MLNFGERMQEIGWMDSSMRAIFTQVFSKRTTGPNVPGGQTGFLTCFFNREQSLWSFRPNLDLHCSCLTVIPSLIWLLFILKLHKSTALHLLKWRCLAGSPEWEAEGWVSAPLYWRPQRWSGRKYLSSKSWKRLKQKVVSKQQLQPLVTSSLHNKWKRLKKKKRKIHYREELSNVCLKRQTAKLEDWLESAGWCCTMTSFFLYVKSTRQTDRGV